MSERNAGTASVAQRAWCVVVPHHAEGARLARRRLAAVLTDLVDPELLADAVAIAAELVGNAVRHAEALPGGVVRLAWRLLNSGTVEIRVTDGGAGTSPVERKVGPYSPGGRGLAIVSALAQRWGVECDGLGQCVWAEVHSAATRPTGTALTGSCA
jgi:anti-sigma regulatory factor (Ser/Thr protein kinase)